MLQINFLPESDLDDHSVAVAEYSNIWKEDALRIITALEKLSGYSFKETFINAVIYIKGSASHPLSLNGSHPIEIKKLVLTHELGHRIILPQLRIIFQKTKVQRSSLEIHKILDLFLYDAYVEVYGTDFAHMAVTWEGEKLAPLYKEAWEFALSFKTKEERQEKLKEMMVG